MLGHPVLSMFLIIAKVDLLDFNVFFNVLIFRYSNLHVSPTSVGLTGNDTINVNVTLENLSRYSGEEVNLFKCMILFSYYMLLDKKNFFYLYSQIFM